MGRVPRAQFARIVYDEGGGAADAWEHDQAMAVGRGGGQDGWGARVHAADNRARHTASLRRGAASSTSIERIYPTHRRADGRRRLSGPERRAARRREDSRGELRLG